MRRANFVSTICGRWKAVAVPGALAAVTLAACADDEPFRMRVMDDSCAVYDLRGVIRTETEEDGTERRVHEVREQDFTGYVGECGNDQEREARLRASADILAVAGNNMHNWSNHINLYSTEVVATANSQAAEHLLELYTGDHVLVRHDPALHRNVQNMINAALQQRGITIADVSDMVVICEEHTILENGVATGTQGICQRNVSYLRGPDSDTIIVATWPVEAEPG